MRWQATIMSSTADTSLLMPQRRVSDTVPTWRLIMIYFKQACAAEMEVRYAALCACRKVHVCHCNSLGGAT